MSEWVIAFVAGFVAGFGGDRAFLYSRTKDWTSAMALTPTRKPVKPPPDWYARWAPTIMLGLIVVVVASFIVTLIGIRADQKQTEQFARNNRDLLGCVGDWADAFSGSSTPVREATVARDLAVREYRAAQDMAAEADDKVTRLFIDAVTRPPDEEPTPEEVEETRAKFLRILTLQAETSAEEAEAYDELNAAEDHLTTVREENPLPAAPEDRCEEYLK